MSTYYGFVCKQCNKRGGFLSRQMWGIGNFDIIETFKFLGLHKDHRPELVSEDSDLYDIDEHKPTEFVEATRGIMPHSNDWELVNKNEWDKVESKWEEHYLELNKEENAA